MAIVLLNNTLQRRKAPYRTMYKIYSIYGTIVSAANNTMKVVDYGVEDEVVTLGDVNEGVIFEMETSVIHSTNFVIPFPIISKFLTFGTRLTTAFSGRILVNYELINATRTQLLIEWFRKGR